MRRYHSHFSRREAEIWPLTCVGQVEPQQKVFAVPPISVGGGLDDIHPMRRGGVKSFVDDLVLGRGVVPSRAATSLRSVETQPLTRRFVRTRRATSPSTHHSVISEWWWCHWLLSLQVVCSALTVQMIFISFFFLLLSFLQSFYVLSLCVFVCVSPLAGGKRENPSLAAWGGAVTVVQTAGQQFERWWWCVFPCSSAVSVSDSFSEV